MKKAIILGVVLSMSMLAKAQSITGTVVDSEGNPMPGAKVEVTGNQNNFVLTDMDGKFTINKSVDEKKVRASIVGWASNTEKAVDGMEIKMQKTNFLSWHPTSRQWFLGFAPALGKGFHPGVIFGKVKNAGWYGKIQFSGVVDDKDTYLRSYYHTYYDGKYNSFYYTYDEFTGKEKDEYIAAMVGYLKRVYGPFYVNIGAGAGRYGHYYESTGGYWVMNEYESAKACAIFDLGVMVRYNNWFIQGGVQANTDFDHGDNKNSMTFATLSVGYAF